MAQTGYTPILIYSSSTTTNVPSAGNLTNSTLGSELAINITDGKLFYKDNSGSVQVIGWKTVPTSAGGTGLTSYTAGDMVYYASGTALSKLAIGNSGYYMSSSGTAPQWNAPAALTKTDDTNVTLTLGGNASTALLNAASLTLGWTGQLAVTRGGTGLSTVAQGDILYGSAANTLAALAKNTTATRYLSNTGSSNNPAWAQIDLTNGVTGTLPVGNGGTGLSSLTANRVLYVSATNTVGTSANFTYNGTDLTVTSGNFVVGTSGNGIDFSATPGTGLSELLADYEEGTWTPILASSGATFAYTTQSGIYTKIGRVVYISCYIKLNGAPSGTTVNPFTIQGLPFTVGSTYDAQNCAISSAYIEKLDLAAGEYAPMWYARTCCSDIIGHMLTDNAAPNVLIASDLTSNAILSLSGFYYI